MRLNHELIIKSLGDVDDTVIAQILATGASAEELAEAQAWIVNDEPLLNAGKPLPAKSSHISMTMRMPIRTG